jgi:oxalate decarboxylase/phosphoglucose isomerase-like protein (cupin superfamily)
MINLQDTSGLPLVLDTQDNSLQPAGEVQIASTEKIKLENVRPILLNKTLRYPLDIYTEYADICAQKDADLFPKNKLHYSMLVIPAGLLGIEYNKTHIFAPDKDKNELTAIVDIIYGRGIIFIQKVKEKGPLDFDTEVNDAIMFKVRKGDRVPIPQKYMYTFINVSNSPLILGRLFEDDGKIDYRTIRREHGMSYYFIRKNARQEVVRNPHYKQIPKLKRVKAENFASKFRLTSQKPIYTQFVYNPDRFKKILV